MLVIEPGEDGSAAMAAAGYDMEAGPEEALRMMFHDMLTATRTTAAAAGVSMSVFDAPIGGQG